jgi:transglutaminase-like putative cysteine protease
MKLSIRYRATYVYEDEAGFSPHVVRLFPRTDFHVRVGDARFSAGGASAIQYRADLFGNLVAVCFFPGTHRRLAFSLDVDLEIRERDPFQFLLASHALTIPFAYEPGEARVLGPFLACGEGAHWEMPEYFCCAEGAPTVGALVAWNAAAFEHIAYERREEGGPLPPGETLARGRGSCRDTAVLFAEVLRRHGIAARLVSGYLWEPEGGDPAKTRGGGNALHAWVEAYLPGAGWVGMDPTNGVFADHHRIVAAAGLLPEEIAPIEGRYYGDRAISSHLETSLEIDPA